MHRLHSLIAASIIAASIPLEALAGTTGGITGRVTDSQTQAPIAGATVVASSPSQTATAATDANGTFRFLSLNPDTYTISFEKAGYDQLSQPGISVFADQVQTLNMALTKTLKTIARVTSRAGGNLLKPGTTGDVYSVNSAGAQAAASLVGPGGLNSAYGAIASVPGVQVDAGESGWFQTVHIRGGDIDQVGYELDGIPVNRAYDNAPMTMLSSLGQQELQIYTGGTPASTDAQGISGYVNQVVKTGTYPGYLQSDLGVGSPAFYHKASVEAGGSTPDRLFSYYVGLGGANQDYRYVDNFNGAYIPNSFFYPMNNLPGANGYVYTGPNQPQLFVQGNAFGIASTQQRDVIANVHFAIPHKNSGLRDDVQALYLTSEVWAQYYSSADDLGPAVGNLTWDDSSVYSGPLMQPVNPSLISPYYFPSSPTNRAPGAPLPTNLRDSNDNGVAVVKLQYQHAFSASSFLRIYGYSLYSNWFIDGPNTAAQPFYGAELADYEIPDHTSGVNLSFTDQLSEKHLLSASASYTQSNLQRYNVGFINPSWQLTNFMNNGQCVSPANGSPISCYDSSDQGTVQSPTAPVAPGVAGQWIVTNDSFNANLNQVHPRFTGLSLSDQWRPNDRTTVNLGLRIENFKYIFGDTGFNDPTRQFWFTTYNAEHCAANNSSAPQFVGLSGCNPGTFPTNLQNTDLSDYSVTRFQPRVGFTYQINPYAVVRGSFGIYARPPNSSWVQYNTLQQDLPSYLGAHFYSYGFNTPDHPILPDTSYNYDLSWEQRFKGTDISFKLTPFIRSTQNQLQNFFIDPQGGLESGLNVGRQQSTGVELAVQKGDFARDGLSGQLSFTYTHSQIRYQNFAGTNSNVIDQLNSYIEQYNSYTSACAGSNQGLKQCGSGAFGGNAQASYNVGGTAIPNPYFNNAAQPLLDRNAEYTTYDVIPGPFAGSNGYAVPYVASMILNYKHQRFAVTPSFSYSSGASYGSPTVWPGYIPQTCAPPLLSNGKADPATCTDNALPLFIPDPYTGQFDNLGAFKEPWRFSMNVAFSYDISPRATVRVALTNIIDHCGQRGYAWDNPDVCVYAALPSGIMAPAGNFYPNSTASTPPPQMLYPYSFWLNNNNTGFVGVTIPMQFNADIQFKL